MTSSGHYKIKNYPGFFSAKSFLEVIHLVWVFGEVLKTPWSFGGVLNSAEFRTSFATSRSFAKPCGVSKTPWSFGGLLKTPLGFAKLRGVFKRAPKLHGVFKIPPKTETR